ncbi:MAG: helix-turn-helix transcriptional regulator [Gammaproteobacteria bacterium]|nr:helix-turn-helix transcriptional regulator [Gammaproteobacteria bacterium]
MKNSLLKENLRFLLEEHQISETHLAKELQIPNTTFHRLLNNADSNPNISSLRPIAHYFQVTVDQLIGDTPLFVSLDGKAHVISKSFSQVPVLRLNFDDLSGIDVLLKSANSNSWGDWVQANLKNVEGCFAIKITTPIYKFPLVEKSIQIIQLCSDFSKPGIYLILDTVKKQCLLRKIVTEGNTPHLVSLLVEGQHIAEMNESAHHVIGRVIQSIVNH